MSSTQSLVKGCSGYSQASSDAALCPIQVLLVIVPGKTGAVALDSSGLQALSLLRQLGMPALIGIASGACPDEAANAAAKMKMKAAAKKQAAAVLASEVRCNFKEAPFDMRQQCDSARRLCQACCSSFGSCTELPIY